MQFEDPRTCQLQALSGVNRKIRERKETKQEDERRRWRGDGESSTRPVCRPGRQPRYEYDWGALRSMRQSRFSSRVVSIGDKARIWGQWLVSGGDIWLLQKSTVLVSILPST